MGAAFETDRIEAKRDQLLQLYNTAVAEAQYDHGHSGYTGTIAESPGLAITDEVFKDEEDAYNWLNDNARKWQDTLAIKVEPGAGKPFWIFGGWYSS